MQDLKQADPEVGKSMQQILDFEGDVQALSLSFEVEYDNFGMLETHELKAGGSSIPVTNANRPEYVDLYVHWYLVTSINHQFDAFYKGFRQVHFSFTLTRGRLLTAQSKICYNLTCLMHLRHHDHCSFCKCLQQYCVDLHCSEQSDCLCQITIHVLPFFLLHLPRRP